MKRLSRLLTALLILTLSACAVVKVPVATGGSKSDGIVTMSYQYGSMEIPEIDWVAVDASALTSCKSWNYTKATAFGGSTSRCTSYSINYGCTTTQVDIKYQCGD